MQGWVLDIGYRYVDMGKFETGEGGTAHTIPQFAFPFSGADGKLRAHELAIGARF
jgi:opacity protein-like surface antigen